MTKYIIIILIAALSGCISLPVVAEVTIPTPHAFSTPFVDKVVPTLFVEKENYISLINVISTPSTLPPGVDAAYFPQFGTIICYEKYLCLHEVAHKIDYEEMDQFSTSKEWIDIVNYYREETFISTGDPDRIENRIFDFPGVGDNSYYEYIDGVFWGGYSEIYASILEHSKGIPENMPELFRKYYDWERIDELMSEFYKE